MDPPCEGCTYADVPLEPESAEILALWHMLSEHARDYVGMDGCPLKIRLEATRAECERVDDPVRAFRLVLMVEEAMYAGMMRERKARQNVR